jgi:hypothetical protein
VDVTVLFFRSVERVAQYGGQNETAYETNSSTDIRACSVGYGRRAVHAHVTVKGTVKDDDLAKAFLSIWLGADPPNPEIKGGLLGGSCR